jgi:hypothetical protein
MTKAKVLAYLLSLATIAAAVQAQLATTGAKVPAWFAGVLALATLFAPQPHKNDVQAPKEESK